MDTSKDSLPARVQLEWAIGLNRMALTFLGVWPKENERKDWKFLENLRIYIALLLMINFLLIPQMCSLLVVRHDLMLVMDNFQMSFPVISSIMKCLILSWKKEDISSVIREIEKDWLGCKTVQERTTMIKHGRLTRTITLAGYFLIMILMLILNVLPFFGLTIRYVTNLTDPGKNPLPVQTHFFYDITKTSNFLVTFVLQAVSSMLAGIYYTGVDCFSAQLILHVCGQLENLSLHLSKIREPANVRSWLSFCVDEHVRLVRFVRIVDNAVNLMLLGQLFIFIVSFCFQGFLFIKIIKGGGNLPILRFTWLVSALLTLLLHMFVYCFVGEILATCCQEVHGAAYNNEWYILQAKDAKMLMLILLRARPPLHITAGKLFPMTLGTFCNVIKTSVSYISVLLAYS